MNAIVNRMGTMLCLNSVNGSNSEKLIEIGKSVANQKSVKYERTRLKTTISLKYLINNRIPHSLRL